MGQLPTVSGSGLAGPLAARAVVKFAPLRGVARGFGGAGWKLMESLFKVQNWRNTNKVEPDAAKDPMLQPRGPIYKISYDLAYD